MMDRGELLSPVTALGTAQQCLTTLMRLKKKDRNYELGCGEASVVLRVGRANDTQHVPNASEGSRDISC